MWASYNDDFDIVSTLLEYCADVGAKDKVRNQTNDSSYYDDDDGNGDDDDDDD